MVCEMRSLWLVGVHLNSLCCMFGTEPISNRVSQPNIEESVYINDEKMIAVEFLAPLLLHS